MLWTNKLLTTTFLVYLGTSFLLSAMEYDFNLVIFFIPVLQDSSLQLIAH